MGEVIKFQIPKKSPFGRLKMEQLVYPQFDIVKEVKMKEQNFYCPDCGCMIMVNGKCINDNCCSKN